MYYNLYLDDIRNPKDSLAWCKDQPLVEWTIVRNYKQFVDTVNEKGVPANVAFDNDLCDAHYAKPLQDDRDGSFQRINAAFKEKTGYDCAKFLVNYCHEHNIKFPNYTVHSLNPVGRENIIKLIEAYKIAVESF